ncbi:MAG TPA: hypothetical protein VGR06_11900 [Actinophytocola sp.]|uniref:hypothetical protein n=1 Tax=Actinophytocola sp. TaxID=1872138 RepID=UPI002DF7AAE5|nr:hypothetical protein [Actinophytocola sp.]
MVDHANYAAYTWYELTEAIFGGLASAENTKSTNDYSKAFVEGMTPGIAGLRAVDTSLANHLGYINGELDRLKKFWQGPAAEGFDGIGKRISQRIYEILDKIRNPYWWDLVGIVQWSLHIAQKDMNWANNQGWVYFPATSQQVWVPPEYIPPGPDSSAGFTTGGYYETVYAPERWEWHQDLAEQAGREVLARLVAQYYNAGPQFQDLPPVPEPGKAPSILFTEKEAKEKEEKQEKDLADKEKKAEDEKKAADKKLDDAQKKQEDAQKNAEKQAADNKKAADKQFNDAQEQQAKQFEESQKQNEDLAKANQPPPLPDGEIPKPGDGQLPGPPDGGLQDVPGLPDGVDGGVPGLPGGPDGPLPVPTFFGGTPVPGGIDLSGDGKPDLDEEGNVLPGADLSKIPPDRLIDPPFSLDGGPDGEVPGFPPGTIFRPPPPVPGLAIGDDKLPAAGAPKNKPFVRPPNLGLDQPPKLTSPAFSPDDVRFNSGKLPQFDGDANGPGKLLKSGGAGSPAEAVSGGKGVPVGGPLLPGRPGGPGAPGIPGMGAGGMGYPPPMGGGMPPPGMGGQQQNQERERQTWLLEDDEIWSDDDDLATTVLGRVSDDDDDEYSPQL